jgi:hypothetical protein
MELVLCNNQTSSTTPNRSYIIITHANTSYSIRVAIMHRALLLPEVVAVILASGATSPRLLYTALTVNKLFFQ